MTPLLTKWYWRVRNVIEARILNLMGNKGLLTLKDDPRDYTGKDLGFSLRFTQNVHTEEVSHHKYHFDQRHLNICVFASFMLALSNRYKMRFSARWLVKLAKREGYISGNGFSYLRAVLDVARKYGVLPYKYMPDEVTDWHTYSQWTEADEKLLHIAAKYKLGAYWRVRTEDEAKTLLQNGYTLTTAGKWYSAMNRPIPEEYLIQAKGSYIGGHAYQCSGYRDYGEDFEVPQTFGRDYGKDGKAWTEFLFGGHQLTTYANEGLSEEQLLDLFKDVFDGWMVRTKTDPACYVVIQGKKHHVQTMEDYFAIADIIGQDKIDHDVHQELLDSIEEAKHVDKTFIRNLHV